MLDKLSCQACHIPYHVWTAGVWAFMDATLTGVIDIGLVEDFYSADPVDPSNPDKSRWYPAMLNKGDVDGQIRTFPGNRWPTNYWADWHQNGTPGDLSDDAIEPIPLWRMLHITGGQPLPGLTDDNGDGRVELNRGAEMLLYMSALKGDDNYSRQVAANPVLVKGKRVWYEDALEPEGVGFFEPEGTGVAIDDFLHIIWALDHNVLPAEESWGYDDPIDPEDGCNHCHRYDGQSPVLDRKVLVDPWDLDGNPVYETVRQMTGLTPP